MPAAHGTARPRLERGRAPRRAAGGRGRAAGRRHRSAGELLDVRHGPGRRAARAAELSQRVRARGQRARAAGAARRGQASGARARARRGRPCATARGRSTSTCCCWASWSWRRAHDAAARAAAESPLRLDPGARARLRDGRARRQAPGRRAGGARAGARACAGRARRFGCAAGAARRRAGEVGDAQEVWERCPSQLARRSSLAPPTPWPETTHRCPSRSHVTTAAPSIVSSR